jgi:protein MAK11
VVGLLIQQRSRHHRVSASMSKRKREATSAEHILDTKASKIAKTNGQPHDRISDHVIQIVTGSYERVLHGLTATITRSSEENTSSPVQFADTFLFNAHSSAIRCLAISPISDQLPGDSENVFLASGGTDERINLYSLSAHPPIENQKMPSVSSLSGNRITENPRNREIGSLLNHSSTITSLYFPSRSKLISSSEDNSIAISRTKDLTTISTVKAPKPKAVGQPSGDTAPQGTIPAGVNDFAVHPSMKLIVSVGKGERCMRLWNLVTGKKAGVLNFGREILESVKEGKYSHGEGRRIDWSPSGNEFAVVFERGVVVFGEDSKPKCRLLPQPATKVHQMCYRRFGSDVQRTNDVLAVSTEDGRILFYSPGSPKENSDRGEASETSIPDARLLAQLSGKDAGVSGRIKDFEIIALPTSEEHDSTSFIITACSDGSIRIWQFLLEDVVGETSKRKSQDKVAQIGKLIGTYETGSRITCLKAFLLRPSGLEEGLSEFEDLTKDGEDILSSDDSLNDSE